MKRKNIVPLLVILGILLVIGGVRTILQPPSRDLAEEADLVDVAPNLKKSEIAKIELYAGAKPDEKVVLAYDEEDKIWRSPTQFDAPLQEETVNEFLDTLLGLQGEFRDNADDPSQLQKYELGDDAAFHVAAYKKDSETPAVEILSGKSPKYQQAFLRLKNENRVLVIDENLRSLAGIYGEEMDQAPTTSKWLDKQIVDVEKDNIRTVELATPDRHLSFAYKEFEVEKDETEEPAADTDESAEQTEQPEAPAEPETEFKWVVASGGPGGEHKQSGLDSILNKLANFTAMDVVDPAKKSEWGLEPPAYKCIVSVEGLEGDVILEGGHPDTDKEGYIRVADAKDDVIYKVSKYNFEQVFQKGSSLFDLPALSVPVAEMDRIEIKQPEGDVVISKSEDEWVVESPKADFTPQKSTIDTIARTVATWRASDYADSPADPGFYGEDARVVTVQYGEDTHELRVGGKTARGDGYFAKLDAGDAVLAASVADFTKIFKAPQDLYERKLFDVNSDDIATLSVGRAEDSFVLENTEDGWVLVAGEERFDTNQTLVEDLIWALEDLQASDIIFNEEGVTGGAFAAHATIEFTMKDGESYTLRVENEKDGAYPAMVSSKTTPFWLAGEDVAELLPQSAALKQTQEEAAPEEAAAEESVETEPEEPSDQATESPAEEHDHDHD